MENIRFGGGFGGDLDLINEPGQHLSIFNSEDPIVHNKVFGLARFDLSSRQMDFNPIGPSAARHVWLPSHSGQKIRLHRSDQRQSWHQALRVLGF